MTDEQRDAYLREALRHAPDAQLQPPADLSAFILNEARAKARDGAPVARPSRSLGTAVWGWLARPSVAAGFAGVMAATLVGLMWWDQPMDPALPRRPEPAAATAPAPVAPEAEHSAATPSPVAAAPAVPPAPPAQQAKRRATTQPELQKEQRKPAQDADKKMAESAAVATPAAAPAAPAAETTGGLAQAQREAAPAAAKPAPPMPPAPAAVAAPSAFADQATRSADTLTKAKSSNAEPARSRLATGAAEATNARGAAKAESNELHERQEADAFATIGRLRAAIAAEPARWAWQRGSGTAQAMNDALYGWLAQLDNATRSPWPTRAARETAPALGRELQLLRDGRVLHTLRLTERGVLWESGQSSRQFELPAAMLAELQATLDVAAP